jgi:hypothetical protein
MLLLLLACTAEVTNESAVCDGTTVEHPGEIPDGWTSAAGCDTVCAGEDTAGHAYEGCYETAEGGVMCQYTEPCDG